MLRAGGPVVCRSLRAGHHRAPDRVIPAVAWRASWRHEGHRRGKAAVATLDEVLEAAKEGDAASPDTPAAPQAAASHISGQQGVLWFANIYPTRAFRLDFRQSLTHHNHETLIPKLLPDGVEVLRMVPREREGGAFVYFRAPPAFVLQVLRNLAKQEAGDSAKDSTSKLRFMPKRSEDILGKVCTGISQYLKTHEVHAFLCPTPVRAHRVLGKPYLEDLAARYPGSRLRIRVEPAGVKVTEEHMYSLLRKYGVLEDLEVGSENKGFSAAFKYTAAAVAARNCLHRAKLESLGVPVEDTSAELLIEYEPFMRKWLREAIVNNARYTIPLFVFCMLGTTYIIWDPLRTVSVQIRLAGCVAPEKSVDGETRKPASLSGIWGKMLSFWGQWSRAQSQLLAVARHLRGHGSGGGLLEDFWADREGEVGELRQWLCQPQDRVMLLTGYRGNGQNALVHHVLDGHAVFVDVRDMLERGGSADDHIFLRSFCRSLGYWPAQGMDRQMTALLDLLLPGSGKLSRENEVLVAVQRILSCVTKALMHWRERQVASHDKHLGETPPEVLPPLFVIEGFTSENKDRREGFFAGLVSWAAYVSEARLARVLFIADSSFAEPAILAALRDRPERLDVQQLRDADLRAVRRILEQHCGGAGDVQLSDEELAVVGGRFRDIAALVAHVKEGFAPRDALRRLVETSETAVRTLLMTGQPGAKWTRPQLWRAAKLLAAPSPDGSVAYDVFLWSVFRGDEAALRSMKESNLISVVRGDPGRSIGDKAQAYRVYPGSPLIAEVYRRLVRHEGLAAVLDLEVAKEDIKREQATLEPYEEQLVKLQEVEDIRRETGRVLSDPNRALRKRKEQLLALILEQHQKLEKYHAARRSAQAVLGRRVEECLASNGKAHSAATAPTAEKPTARSGRWWLFGLA